jgi:hypothetical protein
MGRDSEIDLSGMPVDPSPAPSYDVEYSFLNGEDESSLGERNRGVCFAGIASAYKEELKGSGSDKPDSVLVTLRDSKVLDSGWKLKRTQIRTYLKLCKENGIAPKKSKLIFGKEKTVKLLIKGVNNMCVEVLYAYLSAFRHVRDDPSFVTCVLHLTQKLGINFFIAMSVAARIHVFNSNHSVFKDGRSYLTPQRKDRMRYALDLEVQIRQIVGLMNFLKTPNKFSKTRLTDKNFLSDFGCYRIIDKVGSSCSNGWRVKIGTLLRDKELQNSIVSCDLDKLKSLKN